MRKKITVYLDEVDYRRLRAIAGRRGRSSSFIARDAVSKLLRKYENARRAQSIGVGHSRQSSVAAKAEKLLEGIGR